MAVLAWGPGDGLSLDEMIARCRAYLREHEVTVGMAVETMLAMYHLLPDASEALVHRGLCAEVSGDLTDERRALRRPEPAPTYRPIRLPSSNESPPPKMRAQSGTPKPSKSLFAEVMHAGAGGVQRPVLRFVKADFYAMKSRGVRLRVVGTGMETFADAALAELDAAGTDRLADLPAAVIAKLESIYRRLGIDGD